MSELKPCPFCGGEAIIITGEECAYVQCQEVKMHKALWYDGDNAAADEVAEQWNRRADLPPTLSAAMQLPEVVALVEAFKDQNELMRSALEIAKREGINGEIGTTNWDAYYNKVAVSLKRSASALAAIKEPKT